MSHQKASVSLGNNALDRDSGPFEVTTSAENQSDHAVCTDRCQVIAHSWLFDEGVCTLCVPKRRVLVPLQDTDQGQVSHRQGAGRGLAGQPYGLDENVSGTAKITLERERDPEDFQGSRPMPTWRPLEVDRRCATLCMRDTLSNPNALDMIATADSSDTVPSGIGPSQWPRRAASAKRAARSGSPVSAATHAAAIARAAGRRGAGRPPRSWALLREAKAERERREAEAEATPVSEAAVERKFAALKNAIWNATGKRLS
jgi:hypothetical protein